VDTSTYRGYFIHLAADASLWSFSAQPTTLELPVLPRVIYRPCVSREAALAEAKKSIDYMLAI
jgi:predicted aminopeptidase